jgi:hypothetical protein
MATPIDKYKAKLAELSKPRKGGNHEYISLETGKNVVRLLPGHPNMSDFYAEVFYHKRQMGQKTVSVVCPNNGDEDNGNCPICALLEPMRRSKDKKKKDLYYSWRAKPRYFANAVDRADETPTIKVLAFGTTILKQVLELIVDPEEFGDVLDPREGCDIIIKKTGQKLDTEYTVTPRRQPSPLCETAKEIRALIGKGEEDTKLKDLNEIGSSEALDEDAILALWEGQEADDDDDDDEDEAPKSKKGKKPSKPADDEDEEEEEAPKKVKSKRKPAEDDDDEEEEEVKPSKKVKKPSKPVEDEDDDEDEIPKKPAKKAKKPAEDDEEEEEEEVKPAKKAKKPAVDEDDDDEEDLDAVLAKHKKGVKK